MSELGPLLPKPPAPPAGNSGAPPAPAPATPATATPPAAEGAAVQTSAAVIQSGGAAPAQPQPQQGPAQSPPQPTGQGAPQTPTPKPSTILQDAAAEISASLRELARGGQVDATVIARDGNALLVRTAAGSTLSLPNLASMLEQANVAVLNAALKLQIDPENPQQATVTAANGKALVLPLPVQVQPPTAAQLAIAAAPPPSAAGVPVLPQPGQALTATVQPLPLPANAAGQVTLPPGSQVQVIVQTATLPAATPSASPPVAVQPGPQPVVPQTPPPVPSPPVAAAQAGAGVPSAPLPPPTGLPATMVAQMAVQPAPQLQGQTPPVQTTSQTPLPAPQMPVSQMPVQQAGPQAAMPQPPVLPQPVPTQQPLSATPLPLPAHTTAQPGVNPAALIGQTLTGIVTGQSQSGQVLVSTPQGVLALSLPQPLPPGTQLALELAAITRPPPPAPTTLGPAPLASVLTRLQGEWPVLQQTLDAIRAADPALAHRLQAELLPQPNARLAATALQFMAAAAAGNAQAWLGSEAVRKLEQQGKGELLRKLDDDFRELGRLNQRSGDNDWQALVMPMMIGGKVEPIQIFMRRRRDRKQQQPQTRFIIDFNLESTGPIQFDGLVSVKQLDLILRSETEFGPAFRVDVAAIFEEALAVTGMAGSLRFHEREAPLPWPSPELEAKGPSTELKA
ncbi:hypothetical protein [Ferrovibrio sp.]|uniref:hypothetical protein n=1 Tax=Ferrovibrio sp. TaxID=1917215 RepID=UPI0035B17B40